VVRRVNAPVLVARRPPAAFRRVLVAIAGAQRTAAEAAAALAAAWSAEAAALHVVSEVALPAVGGEAAEPRGDEAERTAAACGLPLLTREGFVAEAVLEEVREGAWDLLVLGVRGERGWGHDDVAERILIHCPASTLIVPASGLQLPAA
jgi:nucleotide-binding universal stress UspA family protein